METTVENLFYNIYSSDDSHQVFGHVTVRVFEPEKFLEDGGIKQFDKAYPMMQV